MNNQSIIKRLHLVLAIIISLLASLAKAQHPVADLNGDCKVDLEDFSILSGSWLIEYDTDDLMLVSQRWQSVLEVPDAIEFVSIPSGSFQMGDSIGDGYSNEKPVRTVTLGSFQMSKYEITNAQYAQFLNAARAQNKLKEGSGGVYAITDRSNAQPWCNTSTSSTYSQIVSSSGDYSVKTRDGKSQTTHPVVQVTWYGAKAFCDFYGYQLPTEAQWEYAARGALSGQRFPWGANITHNQANYYSSTSYSYDTSSTRGYHPTYATGTYPYTSPVGSFPANGYGLCDMSGNVWEWCSDWYGAYPSTTQSNPTGPTSGNYRVIRGGGWDINASSCRVAFRDCNGPIFSYDSLGFRVCRP